jgi:hypothetical protein
VDNEINHVLQLLSLELLEQELLDSVLWNEYEIMRLEHNLQYQYYQARD